MDIDTRLDDFEEGAPVTRAVELALKLRAPSSKLGDWHSLADLGAARGATDAQVEAVRERLAGAELKAVVAALDHLDEQDGVWSNLKAAAQVVRASKGGESNRQPLGDRQGQDAMHKALVLAWAVAKLFPGSPRQQVERFLELETGRALVGMFGLIEVALPFAQEAPEGGLLGRIATTHGEAGMRAVVTQLGPDAAEPIKGVMPLMVGELERAIQAAASDVDAVLGTAKDLTPLVATAADAAGDVVAAGIDLLPVYHLLGPRLVAEAALQTEMLGEPPPEAPPPRVPMPPPAPPAPEPEVVPEAEAEPDPAPAEPDPAPPEPAAEAATSDVVDLLGDVAEEQPDDIPEEAADSETVAVAPMVAAAVGTAAAAASLVDGDETAAASEPEAPEPEPEVSEPEAPEPEPEPEAPESEPEASEPEAPEPEADAPEPEDDAPESEVDAPEPEADAPESEPEASEPEAPEPEAEEQRPVETMFDFMDEEDDALGATEIAINPLLIPDDEEPEAPSNRPASWKPAAAAPEPTPAEVAPKSGTGRSLALVGVTLFILAGVCGLGGLTLGGVAWYTQVGPGASTSAPAPSPKSGKKFRTKPAPSSGRRSR